MFKTMRAMVLFKKEGLQPGSLNRLENYAGGEGG